MFHISLSKQELISHSTASFAHESIDCLFSGASKSLSLVNNSFDNIILKEAVESGTFIVMVSMRGLNHGLEWVDNSDNLTFVLLKLRFKMKSTFLAFLVTFAVLMVIFPVFHSQESTAMKPRPSSYHLDELALLHKEAIKYHEHHIERDGITKRKAPKRRPKKRPTTTETPLSGNSEPTSQKNQATE
uniref:Uncharacterized protein n=1 Tax=Tetranychus urticae TaxID=32264 RepID=T1KQZ9_TETUR